MESEFDKIVIGQLTEIIEDVKKATNFEGFIEAYDAQRVATRARAAIKRFAPPGSAYEEDAAAVANSETAPQWRAEQFAAIAHALRDDYALGGLASVAEIVHADLFDDFLEMANELLSKGFVGPAAVLSGTVLEEQLRKLAGKQEVSTLDERGRPKTVETLSVELRKAGVITEVQRKGVSAWYAQRTEAAHGRLENLDASEVERMIDGVRDFVARHPA